MEYSLIHRLIENHPVELRHNKSFKHLPQCNHHLYKKKAVMMTRMMMNTRMMKAGGKMTIFVECQVNKRWYACRIKCHSRRACLFARHPTAATSILSKTTIIPSTTISCIDTNISHHSPIHATWSTQFSYFKSH